jgi:hypothetical protein
MGKITIVAYEKKIYDESKPDKVCYAIAKEMEEKDRQFKEKMGKQSNFRNNALVKKT